LLEILRAHGTSVAEQEAILTRVLSNGEDGKDARAKGLAVMLRWHWHQVPPPSSPAATRAHESWSSDRTLVAEQVLTADLNTDSLRFLLEMTDSRVHRSLKMRLRRFSKSDWEGVSLPDDSRLPGFAVLNELGVKTQMSSDERDPYLQARKITEGATALTEAAVTIWGTSPFAVVRAAVAKRLLDGGESPLLRALQSDPHPSVRAAALDTRRAREIIEGRVGEKAWQVIQRAAILAKTPMWKLEAGRGWSPPLARSTKLPEPLLKVPTKPRELGPKKLLTAPLAISGQYGLEPKGFARAIEAGVNLFFWEPGYTTLTDFVSGLEGGTRQQLHFIAGTFEADPKRVRADVERTLRTLRIEQISFFMIFWVADWRRLSDEVMIELQNLQAEGKIATCGLSTHDRSLALRAIHEGWDPIMIRHSAAHPGAEKEVFPAAAAAGTSIIAFNCTCYGRLLSSKSVAAADCYRYSLSKLPVRICLCGPADLAEMEQNLEVIEQPELQHEKIETLLMAGRKVYAEDKIFASCIRQV
jgi:aryl-alcohol dehydrogenase-like predicted oxidoreductase